MQEIDQPMLQQQETANVKAGIVDITYYTDPLCCWSWAFETTWRKLLDEFKGQLTWKYTMAGLLSDWNNYHDQLNSVTRPAQMGPVWMHAGTIAGRPIHHRIWIDDPPASSYPACIAVKAAELQSSEAADAFLLALREACMTGGINVAKHEMLVDVARTLFNNSQIAFDMMLFQDDLLNGRALASFKIDMADVEYRRISRFPTLILRRSGKQPVMVTGYKPFETVQELIKAMLS